MSDPLNLYRLQKLDSAIDQKESRLDKIEAILSDDQALRDAQKKLEKAKTTAKQIRIELNQIIDKVEAQRLKRKTTQASLFSGNIKNPKALQDLQMESEALKRTISKLEDEQLEAMIQNEAAITTFEQARSDHNTVLSDKASKNALLAGEKSTLEEDLPGLFTQRESILKGIPLASLQLYESMIKSKGGRAVAEVVDDCCDACGAMLTPGDIQSARSPSTLFRCKTCGRILFKS